MTIVPLIIERYYAITILIEAAEKILGWRRQLREAILIIYGSRASQVIIVTLTIQGYCARVSPGCDSWAHCKSRSSSLC